MNDEQFIKIEAWLNSIDNRLEIIENILNKTPNNIQSNFVPNVSGVEKLAKYLNTSEEKIHHLIDFAQDGEFNLLFKIEGKKESDKHFEGTIIILTILFYCYATDEISTTLLKQKLQSLGIKALDHLSHSLRKKVQYVVLKGKGGSLKFNYKITQPGLIQGIKFLSTRIGTNNN